MIFFLKAMTCFMVLALIITSVGCDKRAAEKVKVTTGLSLEPEYYSMEDFQHMPKIDVHIHINTEGKTIVKEAQANNFRLLVMTVDWNFFPPMKEQVRVGVKQHQEDPDVFAFATAFTLEGWDEPDWADKVIKKLAVDFDNGALGVKIWKNIGMVERDKNGDLIRIDDPKFDPVFQYIKDQNKVLLSHAGEPKNCWLPKEEMTVAGDRNFFTSFPEHYMYNKPNMPSYEDQIRARDEMLEKNREVTFIAVHLASLEWSVDEIAGFLDHFPNASVDLAARISHLKVQSLKGRDRVRNFLIKYQDRILYGSDFIETDDNTNADGLGAKTKGGWLNDWKYLCTDKMMGESQLQGLQLPKIVIDKIYYTNADKIFPKAWKE